MTQSFAGVGLSEGAHRDVVSSATNRFQNTAAVMTRSHIHVLLYTD